MNDLQRARIFFLFIIGYFTFLISFFFHTEFDPYWHIRVGEWIVNNHRVPDTGIFSHTKGDAPWTPHSWLSEVIMYLIFKAWGWPGLVMLGVISATAGILIMLKYLLEKLPPMRALFLMLMAYGMLATHIMPRPHIFALPFMTYWFVMLLNASEQHRSPALYHVLILILWANLHGSFLIGIAYAGFFAFESVVTAPSLIDRTALIKQWAKFIALSVLCLLVTPHGLQGILLPLQLTGQSYATSVISEWLSPNFHTFQFLELWIVVLIAFGFTQKMEMPVLRLVFLIGLIHLSLKHCRYASDLMSLQAPLILAAPLAKHWQYSGIDSKERLTLAGLLPVTFLGRALMISALIGLTVYIFTIKDIEFKLSKRINEMLAIVKEANVSGKVFNSYDVGGYLIFQGFNTFIDSRAELYHDEFIKSFQDAVSLREGEKSLEELLDQYEVSWSFLSAQSPAIAYFNMHSDWTPVYADKYAAIHIRKDQWPKPAIEKIRLRLQQTEVADQ
jgi:hypothetical protein